MATRSEQSHLGLDAHSQAGDHEAVVHGQPWGIAYELTLGAYARYVKPFVDVLGGVLLTLLTLPAVLWIVPSIWIAIGRPAIFRQRRVGRNGKVFTVYKFRTMLPDRRQNSIDWDGDERRRVHKTGDDPRHTLVGRILRKWSLDEIPQFWNVALGQMSLVGPRPEMIEVVNKHYEPWQHLRHAVKPGVTGLWQISERDNGKLMYECTEVDIDYVRTISFWNDVKILLLTVPAALGRRKGE